MDQYVGKALCDTKEPEISSNIEEFEESGTEEFEISSIETFEESNTTKSKGMFDSQLIDLEVSNSIRLRVGPIR
ncbi:hypothetical protein GLOIN_2v1883089 [Rhizophagus irregularis DAOM 181602=DAOM 197198]|nr:hypothetical protein GLOIN_2v1883089 [Rhizophagus irregularis DAOM 181602=DAOM 197198]